MKNLRLKYIRSKMGFTQKELANYLQEAKHLKISRGTIAKYESGVNFPSKRTLKALSKALEVSEDFLAGNGLQTEDIEDTLLNLLQKNFFISYSYSNSNNSTHNAIHHYLEYLEKENEPYNFYKDSNGDLNTVLVNTKFPRYKEIDNFWKNNFKFLFEDRKFKETLIGSNKTELKEEVIQRINEEVNKDIKNHNVTTFINLIDEISHNIKQAAIKESKNKISKKNCQTLSIYKLKEYQEMKNRIKELRKKNSYTQEDLSKLLKNEGISANRTTIYRYESGARVPSEKTWKGLAKIFDVPINYIKGNGLQYDEIPSKILSELINTYYDDLEDIVFTTLKNNIKYWLITKEVKKIADSLDSKSSLTTDYGKLFWKNVFSFLFKPNIFKIAEGQNTIYLQCKMNSLIEQKLKKEISNNKFVHNFREKDAKLMQQFYNCNNKYTFIPAIDDLINYLQYYKTQIQREQK